MLTDKSDIPGVGTIAVFQDTEGNILSIIEPAPMDSYGISSDGG